MELRNLVTVKKINETGSYKKAASILNYAQSTITFQVQQLEKELHIQLFEKRGSRMVLTQEGEDIFPLINNVLKSMSLLAHHDNADIGFHGQLTIALPESLITYKLQEILKDFKIAAPNVKLVLKVMNCFAIFDQLCTSDSDIDVAIHYDVGKYPASIKKKKLCTFPLAIICSPVLTEKERDFTTPHQQKSLCHIQNDHDALSLKLFENYLQKKDIMLDTPLEVWSIESVKKCVMSNLGIAVLPRFTVEKELQNGSLNEIKINISTMKMTAIYAFNSRRWQSPSQKYFLSLLTKDKYFKSEKQ